MPGTHHNSTRQSISSRRQTKTHHRIEVSAGGLVYRRSLHGIEFAMLKDSFGNWTFPKGHVRRRKESRRKAAEREIKEELGLKNVRFIRPLGQIDIWFRDRFVFKGKMVHKFIHYFLFEADKGVKLQVPQEREKGENIQDVAWVPVQKVHGRSAYKDMKPIIYKAISFIKKN